MKKIHTLSLFTVFFIAIDFFLLCLTVFCFFVLSIKTVTKSSGDQNCFVNMANKFVQIHTHKKKINFKCSPIKKLQTGNKIKYEFSVITDLSCFIVKEIKALEMFKFFLQRQEERNLEQDITLFLQK